MRAVRVGIIGCGNICSIYLQSGKRFDVLDITACADIMPGRAEEKAREFGIARACSVAELLGDPEHVMEYEHLSIYIRSGSNSNGWDL